LKKSDGLTLSEFRQKIAENGQFNGIEVTRTNNDESSFEQTRLQFVQALIDNLSASWLDIRWCRLRRRRTDPVLREAQGGRCGSCPVLSFNIYSIMCNVFVTVIIL